MTYVIPRINLFKEYRFSNRDIVAVLMHGQFLEELGIQKESGMLIHGFKALGGYTKDTHKTKVEIFKMTCGWSEEELYRAFTKSPRVLATSENKTKSNMGFLIREAKLTPGSIASRPHLLQYSLQKIKFGSKASCAVLAAKGLKKRYNLSSACGMSEKMFLERYIELYKKEAPELVEAYLFAASSRDISI